MSITIEWFTATSTSVHVLFATDEASDGQRAIDDGGTPQTIALELGNGGGGAAITGTPEQLLAFLADATTKVTEHWTAHPDGDKAMEHGQTVEWIHENGNTMRSVILDVDQDAGMVTVDFPDPTDANQHLQLTVGEVTPIITGEHGKLVSGEPESLECVCGNCAVFEGLISFTAEEIAFHFHDRPKPDDLAAWPEDEDELHTLCRVCGRVYRDATIRETNTAPVVRIADLTDGTPAKNAVIAHDDEMNAPF